jgi:hypothetical protein
MQDDPPDDAEDEFGNMLDDAPSTPPNPYGDECSARKMYFHAWLSKLLVFVFYLCFSPMPSSVGIGPLTGLWFDTIFLKKPNIISQTVSFSE